MTVGQQLHQARQERSLTLEQVAAATHIRVHYLQAMEAGEFVSIPSKVQARGFLRSYADFLGLDSESLLAEYSGEKAAGTAPQPSEAAPANDGQLAELAEADSYFIDIGRQLQGQRKLLGLSLDDIERHTHLRQHYLIALEAGDLDALPSPVQGRGMLGNYASFLGLDPEPLLLRFAEGLQARHGIRKAAQRQERPARVRRRSSLPAPLRRLFSGDFLLGGALVAFLAVFAVWGAIRIFAYQTDQTPTPTAPSIVDVLLASPTASETPTPISVTPTSPPSQLNPPPQVVATDAETGALLPATSQDGLQVYVTVLQRTWMQVTVDGDPELDGRVLPGSAYTFNGEEQVEILTGNGAALQVFYNQQDLGLMGGFGQVVHRVYTQFGISTPTPTITTSPTATLPATATSRPTATPRPGEATVPANP